MDTPTDYYALLGVEPQADASAIKTAFKKLALQYHPDVYKGEDAQLRMRSLLQAYQTLSDPEKREAYDARREGRKSTLVDVAERPAMRKERFNEQGHFAFPVLEAEMAASVAFFLDGLPYELTPEQAEDLWWQGLLRGSTPQSGPSLVCHRCQHHWSLPAHNTLSVSACPACHASDWAEYLLLRCTHCQAVFESKELRDPLRGNVLYHPYELFPLCPHCRRSHWCLAENERVDSLRAAASRRSALLGGSAIVFCVLLVVLIVLVLSH
jgi:hypothetical protein